MQIRCNYYFKKFTVKITNKGNWIMWKLFFRDKNKRQLASCVWNKYTILLEKKNSWVIIYYNIRKHNTCFIIILGLFLDYSVPLICLDPMIMTSHNHDTHDYSICNTKS